MSSKTIRLVRNFASNTSSLRRNVFIHHRVRSINSWSWEVLQWRLDRSSRWFISLRHILTSIYGTSSTMMISTWLSRLIYIAWSIHRNTVSRERCSRCERTRSDEIDHVLTLAGIIFRFINVIEPIKATTTTTSSRYSFRINCSVTYKATCQPNRYRASQFNRRDWHLPWEQISSSSRQIRRVKWKDLLLFDYANLSSSLWSR